MLCSHLEIDDSLPLKMADYTFDGVYFENIEKIGTFQQIINLKNAIKQENEEEIEECTTILENQYPQLYQFIMKHKDSFNYFF